MEFRPLTSEHKNAYFNLITQLNKMDITDFKGNFDEKLKNIQLSGGSTWMLFYKGVIVGTGKVFIEPKFFDSVAHIEDVIIDISMRGIGLGKAMIEKLYTIAKSYGVYKTVLNCNSLNLKFYEKCGFDVYGNQMVKY
jgi:ribosomal protein S18 acetylase RimI-like enzyme